MQRRRRSAAPSIRTGDVATGLAIVAGLALAIGAAISGSTSRRTTSYFPVGAMQGAKGLDQGRVAWYSRHLEAMGEPSLPAIAARDRRATVCRLLWLPSFSHPFAVRIEESRQGATVRVVVLDGMGGYEPGFVAVDRRFAIRSEQWQEIQRRLEQLGFWTLPTHLDDQSGTDGDQYIIECVKSGAYHVVDRWEPSDAYRALCAYVLDLSGLKYDNTDLSVQPGGIPPDRSGFGAQGVGGGMR